MNRKTISVQELQKMLETGQPVTILDVRPQLQREEWKIAESTHIDAYQDLLSGKEDALHGFNAPREVPVVTVCAAGRTSLLAADRLTASGYTAYSLEGGMKAWNYAYNTASVENSTVAIVQVRRVAKGCLSYIIGSGTSAMVIDASLDPQIYIDIANAHGWQIKAVSDTHIHADYISRTKELAEATGSTHYFSACADVAYQFTELHDGQQVEIGTATIQAIHTPGHTPESMCFKIDDTFMLTGDTLFIDGVGRPDLKAGPDEALLKAGQLFESISRIKEMDAKGMLVVLPAHTSSAIPFDNKLVGALLNEINSSVRLLGLDKASFIKETVARIPATPPNYLTIASLNKTGVYEGVDPSELEAGANRCAVS
jgi:glyoxylase-like metal-dependent hydrolase (beta-lactamase superfamily II)/rhodanese-related sulfurtransferase